VQEFCDVRRDFPGLRFRNRNIWRRKGIKRAPEGGDECLPGPSRFALTGSPASRNGAEGQPERIAAEERQSLLTVRIVCSLVLLWGEW
jgi:hypothetical protein